MRGQEFRARDKKVQKMTRDGLTEKNLTAGTEQRISGRLADISFEREKTEDTAAKSSDGGKKPGKTARMRYEKSKIQPEKCAGDKGTGEEKVSGEKGEAGPRRIRQYEKAQRRVEKAEGKLKKVQENLPARTRVRLQKEHDGETGKVKRRLRFETEVIPKGKKPSLVKRAGGAAGRMAYTEAVLKAHQKIREVETDNVGMETAHRAESAAERGAGAALRKRRRRLREKSTREARRAQRQLAQANVDMAYKKILSETPELEKKALAKWIQRQKLKRRYAAAAREAAKEMKHTTHVFSAAGQVVRALAQAAVSHKAVLGIVGIGILIVSMFGSLISSCSAMLSGVQSAVVSTCYVAEDTEINQSELRYTELETDLEIEIDRTEEEHPGYDEYRFNIGEIGHNPYELMGYLSAAYDDFIYAQVKTEINRLFGEQYQLTREDITEIRTYTDEEGEEQEYEWHVLKTTLSVQPLSDIIAGSLAPGDVSERYRVYMQTCGNRQCYGTPFDVAWTNYVTSPYGYRVHPITGVKDLHRGVDIGIAEGTPIKAVQDGTVVSAGNAGGYGLCVVIEGKDGYRSRYAHCSALSVSAGQAVKRGDVIGAVGSTGNSTGPHLHLEVTHSGEYLDPYYYVAGGAAAGPVFAENPGAAMGDGSFEAMLAEAEKYLGYPYVWGGSSPSTSFDCSGFVSWVVNQSGVGNVGRQTAQGLYNLCAPVPKRDMQPGDLIFFTGTCSSANPVTHVGIYIGGGKMIHCGDPVSYADINSSYWSAKFYSGGRLP